MESSILNVGTIRICCIGCKHFAIRWAWKRKVWYRLERSRQPRSIHEAQQYRLPTFWGPYKKVIRHPHSRWQILQAQSRPRVLLRSAWTFRERHRQLDPAGRLSPYPTGYSHAAVHPVIFLNLWQNGRVRHAELGFWIGWKFHMHYGHSHYLWQVW